MKIKTRKRRAPPPPPARRPLRRRQAPPAPEAREVQRKPVAPRASAHVNRVTLNLLRHSTVCPEDLREVLDRWANVLDFQMDRLTRVERELIYATLTDALGDKALAQFEVVPQAITDNRHEMTHCKLCGHNPIRWEFDLRNTAGGRSLRTGSVCIFKHGVNVRGAETAERAYELLKQSEAAATRVADRKDFQEANPDHEDDLDHLRDLHKSLKRYRLPRGLWSYLEPQWKERIAKVLTRLNGAIRYYNKWGYLTDTRSEHVYGAGGLLDCSLVTELNGAIKARKETTAEWREFQARAVRVANGYEQSVLAAVVTRGQRYHDLTAYHRDIIDELARRLKS